MKIRKKRYAGFCALAIALCMLCLAGQAAKAAASDGFTFDAGTGVMTLSGQVNASAVKGFGQKSQVLSVVASKGTIMPQGCDGMFQDYSKCTKIDLSKADFSSVTSMKSMFSGCIALTTLDISGGVSSNLYVFHNCFGTNAKPYVFHNHDGENPPYVFYNSNGQKGGSNNGGVTGVASMFAGCTALDSLKLGNWFTSVSEDMCLPNGSFGWSRGEDGKECISGDKQYAVFTNSGTNVYRKREAALLLTIKHNIEFDNNIAMHYVIPKSELAGYSNIKLVIDKEVYEAGVATPTTKQYVLENPASYVANSVDCWHFTFPGIAASEMGNVLKAKVVCVKNGTTLESQVDTYSVKEYAYNRLDKTSNATYRTVLVDMLNYGAEAQTHFKKNAGHLVNANLTATQQAYGTSLNGFSVSNCENLIGLNGATASFEKKNLLFDTNVVLAYRMEFASTQNMANVKVVFQYNNGTMNKSLTVPSSKFTKSDGKYVAYCDCLLPKEMGCTVNATIYDGSKAISGTLQYSIESYVANRLTESSSDTYKTLLKRMVLYGRAVKTHFVN